MLHCSNFCRLYRSFSLPIKTWTSKRLSNTARCQLYYWWHNKFYKPLISSFFYIFLYIYVLYGSFYVKYMGYVMWSFTEKILRNRFVEPIYFLKHELCRCSIESDSCERSTGEIERSLESRCKYHSCDNNHPRRPAATVLVIILPKRHVIPTTPADRDNHELRGRYWPSQTLLVPKLGPRSGGMEATERGFFANNDNLSGGVHDSTWAVTSTS